MEAGEVETNYTEDDVMSGEAEEELVTRYQCELIRKGMVTQLEAIEGQLKAMWKKIDGRPSWAVLVIITGQTSLIVGLIVGILMAVLK